MKSDVSFVDVPSLPERQKPGRREGWLRGAKIGIVASFGFMIAGPVGGWGIADEDYACFFLFGCGMGAYASLLVATFLCFGAMLQRISRKGAMAQRIE